MSTRHTPDLPPEHNPAVEASSLPRHVDSAQAVNCVPEPAPPVTPLRDPLSRPPMAAAPPVPEPEISACVAQGPTADELPRAGMRSQIPRTVKLAEKIALMVHDLRGRVADERRAGEERHNAEEEKAQARADVERLTREPAAATARLQGKTSGAPAAAAPNEGLDRRGRHINRTPANCADCANCGKRSGTSASAISSLTSWASRTGPKDGPTSTRQLCRAAGVPPGHAACCSALVGDRDA
jgi:hypothetical protein